MPRQRVLLTGASSLTGTHILHQLLALNIAVRAVVGSRDEARSLERQFAPQGSANALLLDFAVVPATYMNVPGAYNEALDPYPSSEPFDTVIHTVPSHMSEQADCLSRFINLESEGLVMFLRSVKEVATKARRVIITTPLSPFAQWLVHPQPDRSRRHNGYYAQSQTVDSEYILAASRASDNIVHDQLWKWAREANAHFDLVSITAPSIYGPSIRSLNNSTDFEEANRRIWNICANDNVDETVSPPYGIDYFTDVRDLALAHVQATRIPQAGNRRFVIASGVMPPRQAIADFLATRFPEFGGRIHSNYPSQSRLSNYEVPLHVLDTTPAATILGITRYRSAEDTLTDVARQILDLNRRRDWRRIVQS